MSTTELDGMKAICNYVKRSEATVMDWIRNMEFPAKKLGGTWVSDVELIVNWKRKIITKEGIAGNNVKNNGAKQTDKTIKIGKTKFKNAG